MRAGTRAAPPACDQAAAQVGPRAGVGTMGCLCSPQARVGALGTGLVDVLLRVGLHRVLDVSCFAAQIQPVGQPWSQPMSWCAPASSRGLRAFLDSLTFGHILAHWSASVPPA